MASGKFFPAAGFDLGVATSYATFNQATLPRPGMLGQINEDGGICYRLVQFDNGVGNVAAAAGAAAYWKTRASSIVTSDESDGEGLLHGYAGFFLLVVTDQNYCFVQVGGPITNLITDGNVAKGGALILTTTDGTITSQAAGSVNTKSFGYADADDAATVGTGYLNVGAFI